MIPSSVIVIALFGQRQAAQPTDLATQPEDADAAADGEDTGAEDPWDQTVTW